MLQPLQKINHHRLIQTAARLTIQIRLTLLSKPDTDVSAVVISSKHADLQQGLADIKCVDENSQTLQSDIDAKTKIDGVQDDQQKMSEEEEKECVYQLKMLSLHDTLYSRDAMFVCLCM